MGVLDQNQNHFPFKVLGSGPNFDLFNGKIGSEYGTFPIQGLLALGLV